MRHAVDGSYKTFPIHQVLFSIMFRRSQQRHYPLPGKQVLKEIATPITAHGYLEPKLTKPRVQM
jgi:hypothetical protein